MNFSFAIAAARSRSVTLPALTPRSSDFMMRLRPAVVSSSVGSYTSTSTPARADTSAMPAAHLAAADHTYSFD